MHRILFAFLSIIAIATSAQASFVSEYYAPGTPLSGGFVIGPTSPGKWGTPGFGTPGGVVTWSLMATGITTDGGLTTTALSAFMPAGFHDEIVSAFAAWSNVANISFLEVPDSGLGFDAAGAGGDIRIGGHVFDGSGGVLAHGFFPPANGVTAAGDIHFDKADTWKIGFSGPGFSIFQVAAHEIGHAIGLDHTLVAGSLMNAFYTEAFVGPQADDIAGAQAIYGPAVTVPAPGAMLLALIGLPFFGLRGFFRRRHAIYE